MEIHMKRSYYTFRETAEVFDRAVGWARKQVKVGGLLVAARMPGRTKACGATAESVERLLAAIGKGK